MKAGHPRGSDSEQLNLPGMGNRKFPYDARYARKTSEAREVVDFPGCAATTTLPVEHGCIKARTGGDIESRDIRKRKKLYHLPVQ